MTFLDPGEVERLLRSCALRSRETFDLWLHRHLNHRLLAWVAASKCAGKLCVKGSALLDIFQVGLHRPVCCVDFLALEPVRPDELRQALGDIHAEVRGDGVSFDMGSLVIEPGKPYRGHGCLRGQVVGHVGEMSRRVDFRIDAGAGIHPAHVDALVRAAVEVKGQVGARLRAYLIEAAAAEKLENLYWSGVRGCRFQDIADLYLLVKSVPTEIAGAPAAIRLAFAKFGLPPPAALPAVLQPEFTADAMTRRHWKQFVRREHVWERQPPGKAAPAFEALSLEVAATFLRDRVARWLFEGASPSSPMSSVAQAAGRSNDPSRMSAQQLEQAIAFARRRQSPG